MNIQSRRKARRGAAARRQGCRSSPARPAASGSASPGRWPRPGSAVVLNGFGKPEEIEATRDAIAAEFGVKVAYSAADMTKPELDRRDDRDDARHLRQARHPGQQCRHPACRALEEFPVEKWDAILAINLSSAFHTTRLALPSMVAEQSGRIINIASAHGLVASPFKSAYVAAKHGMLGLTKVTALETAEAGHHLQRHLPRLCLHAAGRGADRRPGQGARHPARAGDPRRVAGAAAEQALRHRRGDSARSRCSSLATPPPRSPAPPCRSMAAGPRIEPRSQRSRE